MAKNYISEGKAIYVPTATGLLAGAPFVLGSHQPCVLLTNAEAASPYNATVQTFGIFDLPVEAEGGAISQYAALFFDATDGKLNDDGANNKFFGVALEAVATGTITIPVLIAGKPYVPAAITATDIASNAVTTAKILAANVTEAKLEAASLTGLVAKVVADDAVIGGIPVIHRVACLAGAAKGNKDITLTHKTRITDAWVVLGGAGVTGATVQIKNTANVISDAINISSAVDKDIVRAGALDRAYADIAAGGVLRVTSAATGDDFPTNTFVYISGYRVA